TKEVGKGSGLGLAMVYGIVRQHEGWVEVYSEVNVGSTFRIFFPRASATAVAGIERIPTEAEVRGGHETILVVEDESALRDLVKTVLQHFGYHVLEAGSGVEAQQVWAKHRNEVSLLLTDMVMPE